MLKNVDQSVALLRLIERRPIGDVFDSVAFKELRGVFAEAREQVAQLSGSGMIDAEFVDATGGRRRAGVVLPGSGPK